MTLAAPNAQFPRPDNSILIAGGKGAPARARRHLLARLDVGVCSAWAADAALIISELVTNSVVHAEVGADRAILLELTAHDDHLRIAVIDPGSDLEPRIRPADPNVPGGFGLRLVRHMSSAWDVVRECPRHHSRVVRPSAQPHSGGVTSGAHLHDAGQIAARIAACQARCAEPTDAFLEAT